MPTVAALLLLAAALLTAGCAGEPANLFAALQPPGSAQPVAAIVDSKDAVWVPPPPITDRFATPKLQPLRLKSGTAAVKFHSGVTVMLTGPVEFAIISQSRGQLRSGSLAASVPDEAHGFTLDLPAAAVVALGGAFSATVEPDGQALVRVGAGNVMIAGGDSNPTRVPAGGEIKLPVKAPPAPPPWQEAPEKPAR